MATIISFNNPNVSDWKLVFTANQKQVTKAGYDCIGVSMVVSKQSTRVRLLVIANKILI